MTELDDIVDSFELLGDWDSRYQYLVELGEQLPPIPETQRIEANKVKGCMSQVWIYAYRDPDAPPLIQFGGDCDTGIIKGVLAVILQWSSGRTVEQIQQLDVDELFERLKLDEHLSPNRHVGVYAMVDLVKQKARRLVQSPQRIANA